VRLAYDATVNAVYIDLADRSGKVARTVALDDGTNVDLDAAGDLLGIEVIGPDRNWPLPAILRQYEVSDQDAAMLMAGYPFAFSFSVSAA
jgi:uncharacterized protein YuzE